MEWNKMKKYNPNGPGYPEAGYWYVLQSEAEERIEKLQADLYEGNCELEKQQRINRELEARNEYLLSENRRLHKAEAKLRAVVELPRYAATNDGLVPMERFTGQCCNAVVIRVFELEALLKEVRDE